MATRRPASNSTTALIDAMTAATKPYPDVPEHVRLCGHHMPFWDGILRARMREEWNSVTLVIAGQLARCQYDIEHESLMLECETSVIENARGTLVANPRVGVLEALARREMALMRSLQIGGNSDGRQAEKVKNRQLEAKAGTIREQVGMEDDLLAT